jgi:hypothetical protein
MKTKPFNLKEALNGAKVVTRDGKEVKELTKFEGLKDYPLVGVLDNNLATWTTQGTLSLHLGECRADLFLAVEPQRIWVNAYHHNGKLWLGGRQYDSLTEAKLNAVNSTTMQYIKTIEITDEL